MIRYEAAPSSLLASFPFSLFPLLTNAVEDESLMHPSCVPAIDRDTFSDRYRETQGIRVQAKAKLADTPTHIRSHTDTPSACLPPLHLPLFPSVCCSLPPSTVSRPLAPPFLPSLSLRSSRPFPSLFLRLPPHLSACLPAYLTISFPPSLPPSLSAVSFSLTHTQLRPPPPPPPALGKGQRRASFADQETPSESAPSQTIILA